MKSELMTNIVERSIRLNLCERIVSMLIEIDYKKFNIFVNVPDLMALISWIIERIFGDQKTGYTQVLETLKGEYQIKKMAVSYRSLISLLKIVMPTWKEVCRDHTLLTRGLNPRASVLVKSMANENFEKLIMDIKNEFVKSSGCNV